MQRLFLFFRNIFNMDQYLELVAGSANFRQTI